MAAKIKIYSKILSLLFFILIPGVAILSPVCSNAQVFEKRIKTDKDDLLYSATELNCGGYALIMARGDYDGTLLEYQTLYQQFILKIGTDGNILDSLVNNNTQAPYIEFIGIIGFEGFTVCWGRVFDADFNPIGLYLLKTDNELHIVADTILYSPKNLMISTGCIKNSYGNLIVSGRVADTISNQERGFVWEVSPGNLTRLREKYFNDMPYVYYIMEMPAIGGYHFYGDRFIYGLDYELNNFGLLWESSGMEPLREQGSRKVINDSTYVVLGYEHLLFPDGIKPDIAFSAYNTEINPLNYISFGKVDTTDTPYMLDFIHPDSIFICGSANLFTYGSGPPATGFDMKDTWIDIFNYGWDGTYNWNLYYGGDAEYLPGYILATLDGGCLVVGSYYDWRHTTAPERDGFILKLDSEGTYTSVANEINPKKIQLYPNPGGEVITVVTGLPGCQLELFDITGRLMISNKLHSGSTLIGTSSIESGVYLYSIRAGNRIIENGKWIKR